MMTYSDNTSTVSDYKAQAKRLRTQLREAGTDLTHSQSLELVARQHGARDWNTLRAMAGNELVLRLGQRVSGHYLGQPFTGEVKSLTAMEDGAHRRITLHFDQAVDVVTFDSFSAYRQRVSGIIGPDGVSPQKTSNGQPQLVVHPG